MVKSITLTQGYIALVDDSDYELVRGYKWHVELRKSDNPEYRVIDVSTTTPRDVNGKQTQISLHSMILNPKPGEAVYHKDNDPLNNCRNNLCVSTQRAVTRHRRRHTNNRSGFKGVRKRYHKYHAEIWLQGKSVHLGSFSTATEAACAYNKAAIEHFGRDAHINIL
jgi:hypothetical protein